MPSVITLEGARRRMKKKKELAGAKPIPEKGTKRCLYNPRTGRGHLQVATGNRRLPWQFAKGTCIPDED